MQPPPLPLPSPLPPTPLGEHERDLLVIDCVNFERQLLRCHELAVQRSAPADPPSFIEFESVEQDDAAEAEADAAMEGRVREARHQLVLDQLLDVLQEQLTRLKQIAETEPLPRPVDLEESERKLNYVFEVLQRIPSGAMCTKAPFAVMAGASGTSVAERNAESAAVSSAQAVVARKWREALFSVDNQSSRVPFGSKLNGVERFQSDDLMTEPDVDLHSVSSRSPMPSPRSALPLLPAESPTSVDSRSNSPLPPFTLRERRSHQPWSTPLPPATTNATATAASVAVEAERDVHEQMRGEIVEMAVALKRSVQQIGDSMRQDNAVMDEVEQHASDNLSEIGRQQQDVKKHLSQSARWACGTYFLLLIVAITFVLTYLLVKIIPKAQR